MRRIFTIILSTMLTITVSAQERTPVDKICEDIYTAVPGLPRLNDKIKSHQGDGIVTYSNRAYFDGIFYVKNPSGNDIKSNLKKMIGIIKHNLDSLMEFSENGNHYESHGHDADTIKYFICLSNGPAIPETRQMGDITYITPDDDETVSFNYTRNKRNFEYRGYPDFVNLEYHKNVFLSNRQNQDFDKSSYLKEIAPVLKHKDIKSWDFKWSQREGYDIKNNIEDILFINHLSGDFQNEGQATGTMYFIPKEKKELAESVLAYLDRITLRYTETNPNLRYTYFYDMKDWAMRYTEGAGHNIKEMFIANAETSTEVFYGVTSQGYYIAIADTEKNFCVPSEWFALKVFDHGKKEYISGISK